MQKDFHYYVIYYLCLCAGLEPDIAYKIAYSSQYVDDSTESRKIFLYDEEGKEVGFIDPVRTAHNGLESFWKGVWEKIYYPFHFVPGNKGEKREEKYITISGVNNTSAYKFLSLALESKNPYRIGIALHAYADTFSHQNFSGRWSEVNSVQKLMVYSNFTKKLVLNFKLWIFKILRGPIPTIGHVEAYKVPDIPYYNWVYFNYKNEYIPGANEDRYLSFAQNVYNDFLCKLSSKIGNGKAEEFINIKNDILLGINREGSLRKRCKYWKKLISKKLGIKKFPKHYKYDKHTWRKEALGGKVNWDKRKRLDQREIYMVAKSKFLESHWVNFHRAALGHRIEALKILTEKELTSKDTYEQVARKIVGDYKGKVLLPILSA